MLNKHFLNEKNISDEYQVCGTPRKEDWPTSKSEYTHGMLFIFLKEL